MSLIFRSNSEIQTIFQPKNRWSPKKKRSSPKLSLIFRPKSHIQTLFHTESRHLYFTTSAPNFLWGGAFSIFHQKSASKATKTCNFAYFTSQWGGGARAPPPPLATLLPPLQVGHQALGSKSPDIGRKMGQNLSEDLFFLLFT